MCQHRVLRCSLEHLSGIFFDEIISHGSVRGPRVAATGNSSAAIRTSADSDGRCAESGAPTAGSHFEAASRGKLPNQGEDQG